MSTDPDWKDAYDALEQQRHDEVESRSAQRRQEEMDRQYRRGAASTRDAADRAVTVAADRYFEVALTLALRDVLRRRIEQIRRQLGADHPAQVCDEMAERILREEDHQRRSDRLRVAIDKAASIENGYETIVSVWLPEEHYRLRYDPKRRCFL